MKILIAAIAVTAGILSVSLPASAEGNLYGSSWQTKALNNGS